MNKFIQRGCTAIVTGAASGLGKGLADALVARGLTVLYTDINAGGVQAAATATDSAWEVLDVADTDAVAACIDRFATQHGKLHLIINNAGFALAGEALHTSAHDYKRVVDVNLMGVVNGSLPAYQRMAAHGGGHVVNIASLAGLVPFPFAASYALTKAGVVNFSHSLRCEGEALGVQVSVVCPAFIETQIFDNAQTRNMDRAQIKAENPLPSMPLAQAVTNILKGVDRNQATIVFPFHAKLLWWLVRMLPIHPNAITRKMVSKARALRT